MKRIISLILALVLMLSISVSCFAADKKAKDDDSADTKKVDTIKDENRAQIDLSTMSYEELVTLKNKINLAMWNSDEWEEVTVPQGVWIVGEDIPAEHWTIKAADGAYANIKVCNKLDETKKDVDYSEAYSYEHLTSASRSSFDANSDIESTDFDLADWKYVIVNDGSVVFTPYEGKPSLSFK